MWGRCPSEAELVSRICDDVPQALSAPIVGRRLAGDRGGSPPHVRTIGLGGTHVRLLLLPLTFGSGELVYAPTVLQQVLPGTVTTGAAVYAPTLSVPTAGQVNPGPIVSAEVVYAPTVFFPGLAVLVYPEWIGPLGVVFGPWVGFPATPPPPPLVWVSPAPGVSLMPALTNRPPPLSPAAHPLSAPLTRVATTAPQSLTVVTAPSAPPLAVTATPAAPPPLQRMP